MTTESDIENRIELFLSRVRDAGLSLVSRADRARLRERHLNPSLECLEFIPEQGRLLDIGSGGGFPGVPIAIHRPELQVTLVESNTRKASFLRRVSRETTLNNVEVLHLRVEELGETHENQYDIVTARAVTGIPEIIRWTPRFLKPTGHWLLWRERDWRDHVDLQALGVNLTHERALSDGSVLIQLERL